MEVSSQPLPEVKIPHDGIIESAAIKVASLLSKRLNKEVSVESVAKEMNCIKSGIMTDDIPLNIEVYREMEEQGINLLYLEVKVRSRKPCFKNNPAGDRIVFDPRKEETIKD